MPAAIKFQQKVTERTFTLGLYSGGLIIRRISASEIWGAYFREGFFFSDLFVGGLSVSPHTSSPDFLYECV